MSNPQILNLDEVELPQSGIAIHFKGEDHKMRTLTVGGFVEQQRRSKAVSKAEAEAAAAGEDKGDIVDMIVTVRDQVQEFFPTLPVDELETAQLFKIFSWLNETVAEINKDAAPTDEATAETADASAEGNGATTNQG